MTEIIQDNTIYIEEERLRGIANLSGRVIAKKFIRKARTRLVRFEWSTGTNDRPRYFDMLDTSVQKEVIAAIEMIMFEVPYAVGESGQYTRYKYYVLRWDDEVSNFIVSPAYVE